MKRWEIVAIVLAITGVIIGVVRINALRVGEPVSAPTPEELLAQEASNAPGTTETNEFDEFSRTNEYPNTPDTASNANEATNAHASEVRDAREKPDAPPAKPETHDTPPAHTPVATPASNHVRAQEDERAQRNAVSNSVAKAQSAQKTNESAPSNAPMQQPSTNAAFTVAGEREAGTQRDTRATRRTAPARERDERRDDTQRGARESTTRMSNGHYIIEGGKGDESGMGDFFESMERTRNRVDELRRYSEGGYGESN